MKSQHENYPGPLCILVIHYTRSSGYQDFHICGCSYPVGVTFFNNHANQFERHYWRDLTNTGEASAADHVWLCDTCSKAHADEQVRADLAMLQEPNRPGDHWAERGGGA